MRNEEHRRYGFLGRTGGEKMNRLRRKAGFTLIELLVVVAIISVLVALLFPVARKVRLAAMNVACQSNMRQIGSGLVIYQSAFRHLMLANNDTRLGAQSHARTVEYPAVTPGGWTRLGLLNSTGILRGTLGPYNASTVFLCPIWEATNYRPSRNSWTAATATSPIHVDYSMRILENPNDRLDSMSLIAKSPYTAAVKVVCKNRVTILSDRADSSSASGYDYHAEYAQDGRDGYNFLFNDGSVEHLSLDAFLKAYNSPLVSPTGIVSLREFFGNADRLFGINQ